MRGIRFATFVSGLVLAAVGAAQGADSILYVVEGGRLVFTNTPDTDDARPIPGFAGDTVSEPRGDRMPQTIYDPFIERVADEMGLSASLIKAVAIVESGFDPHAVSPKGAQGLMQLMPATARQYGVEDAFDPLQNLRAGATHLRRLIDEFDGDVRLALAAYNAGSGAVRRHGGVPDYRETVDYVRRVQEKMGPVPRQSRPARPRREGAAEVRIVRGSDGSISFTN